MKSGRTYKDYLQDILDAISKADSSSAECLLISSSFN